MRKKILLILGTTLIILFVILRFVTSYGEPSPWSVQSSAIYTFMSFISVMKYPASLLYVLITLGPALIFLSLSENWVGKLWQYVIALGRVPMFYYIIHLYLIHILA